MAILNIELPDAMTQFVNSKVGSGRLKDPSAYLQMLVAEAMETQTDEFREEQRERIDQLLLESTNSFERGEYVPLRQGEFEEAVKRVIEQHQGKQAL